MRGMRLAAIVLPACFLAGCAGSSTVDMPSLVGRWRAGNSTFGSVTRSSHAAYLTITRNGDTYFLRVESRTGGRDGKGGLYMITTRTLSPVEIELKGNRLYCTDARAADSLARHFGNEDHERPYWELIVHEGRLCLDYRGRTRDPLGVGPIPYRTYQKLEG